MKQRSFLREWVIPIGLTIILTVLFRMHVAEARYIPSESMEPTIATHDMVLIDKIHKDVARGDIVVFRTPKLYQGRIPLIKRVVGLPGETLEIRAGNLYIDNRLVEETYLKEPVYRDFGPFKISANKYFLMGDNRNNSYDSRFLGPIGAEQIQGKYIVRIPLSSVIDAILDVTK